MGFEKQRRPVQFVETAAGVSDQSIAPPLGAGGGGIANPFTADVAGGGFDLADVGGLGVGTASPNTLVHFLSDDSDLSPQVRIQNNGTGNTGIRYIADSQSWSTGINNSDDNLFSIVAATGPSSSNASGLRMRTTGEVGVGKIPTTGRRLDIGTTGQATALYVDDATGRLHLPWNDTAAQFRIGQSSDLRLMFTGSQSVIETRTGDMTIGCHSTADLLLKTDNATRVTILSTSEVGIGKTPAAGRALDIGTTGQATSFYVRDSDGVTFIPHDTLGGLRMGAGSDLRLGHDGSNSRINSYAGGFFIGTENSNSLWFETDSSPRGRFDADGTFILGDSTAQAGSRFDVQTTGQAHALYVADADGTLHSPWDGTSGSPNMSHGASNQGRIYYSGTAYHLGSASPIFLDSDSGGVTIRALSATGGVAALELSQADIDQEMIRYTGTSAANATRSITSWTTGATIQGFVRVAINGTDRWMPFYDAPTS